MEPIRIGIIGMGGFAGWHHNTIARLEERGLAKLVCTCDPNAAAFATEQQNWRLAQRGVCVFPDYRQLLGACRRELDLLVVPTPINLHAEMHRAGIEAGIAVYLEKPPTLDYAELETMITLDQKAKKSTLVAFNFIVEKPRLALKQRLLNGEFGAVTGARLMAHWPRPADYFRRSAWAGRLMMNARVVLDSCFGNANAHFVHNMLFWLGQGGLSSWAQLSSVRAELYRAHAIEGADTFFVQALTQAGQTMRFAVTHACAGQASHMETVICENAEIRYAVGGHAEVRWRDGRNERIEVGGFDGLTENHLAYHRYLRGEAERPATSLVDSRPFVMLNDLSHVSSGRITPFPAERLTWARDEKEQKVYSNVAGMSGAIDRFLEHGTWPGADWGREPGALVTTADLPRFHDTVRQMLAATTR
ncbi:MAG: Gfo/Idh/MocA family oxidoreductase [Opitutaceae bacterium]|nr:Gfo/Idh/MocA family oxidoreductase [Opitutaceae bacterium]